MIRMEYGDLTNLLEDSRRIGEGQGSVRQQESIKALVAENSKFKTELDTLEARSRTREMVAGQQASFPAMNAERQRIARGIVQYFETAAKQKQRPTADKLLFGLALGDLV